MRSFRSILGAAVILAASTLQAAAQTSPTLTYGQVLTPAQWAALFAGKQDFLGSPPLLTDGGTMTGPLITAASTAIQAGLNLPPGVAPTSPNNGDIWSTAAGFFGQANGVTYGPFTEGTAGGFTGTFPVVVTFPGGVVNYALNFNSTLLKDGSNNLGLNLANANTWTGTQTFPAGSITNGELANSTISGIPLGSNLDALTFGTHLMAGGTSYNGSVAVTISSDATSLNTPATQVARDSSGNFSAGTITASLTGHASLDLAVSALGTGVQGALGNPLNAANGLVGFGGNIGAASGTSLALGAGSAITSSGPGGALGSNAFTSTAFLPLAGGTMSGNIAMGANGITGTGADTAGSLALGGASIGSNVLSLTGTSAFGGTVAITSGSATALTVGPNGATNPVLTVNTAAASQASGLSITGAVTAGTVAIAATDSGANTNLSLDAKGGGEVTIGASSGGVRLATPTTISSALTYGGITLANTVTGTGSMVLSTAPTITGLTVSSAFTAPGLVTFADLSSAAIATSANIISGAANVVVPAANIYSAETTTTFGTTTTFDFSTFINTNVTLTGNITTMSVANVKAGQAGQIRFIQDGTGSRTTVWNSVFKFAGGVTPSLSTAAGAIDVLFYSCISSTLCYSSLNLNMK
jgi:hypothetical protein